MIKVSRNAELDMEGDLSKSYINKIIESVKERTLAEPVRLVYDKEISNETLSILMKKLIVRINLNEEDSRTYIDISYRKDIKPFIKYKEVKPTIHKYDITYSSGTFIHVTANEWNTAIHLPVEDFRKASKSQVWMDSRAIIKAL